MSPGVAAFDAFKVLLEIFVLLKEFLVKALLHLKIPAHVLNLSVPEVKFIPLLAVGLLRSLQLGLQLSGLLQLDLHLLFEVLNLLLKGLFVGIEGCPHIVYLL